MDLIPLSSKTNEIINEIFINNERIMEQFVRDLFLGRVQVINALIDFSNAKMDIHQNLFIRFLLLLLLLNNKGVYQQRDRKVQG